MIASPSFVTILILAASGVNALRKVPRDSNRLVSMPSRMMSLPACQGPLVYSTTIVIENQYSGKWMLQRNEAPRFTTDQGQIDNLAAVWKIRAPQWEGHGNVSYGDEIRLENQYPGKWLLQRNGTPTFTTDPARVRIGAATWKIHDSRGNARTGVVDCNHVVTLVNQYPGKLFLQRNSNPTFTSDTGRITSGAAQWKLRPVCGSITVQGGWVPKQFFHVDSGVSLVFRVGVTNSSSITERDSWERSVSTTVSSGFSVFGLGVEVSVTSSFTRASEQSVTRAFEHTWENETRISPKVSGQMWQFAFDATGVCGNNEIDTETYVMTNDLLSPPCCPPGLFADADVPRGPCMRIEHCLCDAAICGR